MKSSRCRRFAVSRRHYFWPQALLLLVVAMPARGQTLTNRGFVEGVAVAFPQQATNDPTRLVGDLLVRDEVFFKAASWVQFAGGLDLRANSHDQVDPRWRMDWSDRGVLRSPISVRRLTATFNYRTLTIDAGKQFIRWGKTDIVTPTDRFAPRDFLNVVNSEFLAVSGVRASVEIGGDTVEAVWVPRFTPSRIPLLDQRWAVLPRDGSISSIVDAGSPLPVGGQAGARWSHVGSGFEYSLSFFDGFSHLPDIDAQVRPLPSLVAPAPLAVDLTRIYPDIRAYGADAAVPTPLATLKGEAAYVTSRSSTSDDYVLYAIQLERQAGEWVIVAGYAGEAITSRRAARTFAPDRGLTRAFVARASYTIDSNRSAAIEGVARHDWDGFYVKAEYSHARGQHWRATVTSVALAGDRADFLGQYRRNSHLAAALRYSF